ncbi:MULTISPECIES: hypothetical protein [Vibrio]|nr:MULTISPECIES: hypothetical protein [Vibrio]MDZ5513578.1 hypothetical protein [Vibrio fluvialis]
MKHYFYQLAVAHLSGLGDDDVLLTFFGAWAACPMTDTALYSYR